MLFLLLSALAFFGGCKKHPVQQKYLDDPSVVRILTLQDERNTSALIPYLRAKKAEHRTLAAYAFASIRDTAALPYLYLSLLAEKETNPRRAAAYAIGQTGDSNSVSTLIEGFKAETSSESQAVMLEAIGKCGGLKARQFLTLFQSKEAMLDAGKAWGLFRLCSKKQFHPDMLPYLLTTATGTNLPSQTAALNALLRSKASLGDSDLLRILSLQNHPDEDIRILSRKLTNAPAVEQTLTFSDQFMSNYQNTENPYHKVAMIRKLSGTGEDMLPFLENQSALNHPACIRNAATEKYLTTAPYNPVYADFLLRCLRSRDPALISLAAIQIGTLELAEAKYVVEMKKAADSLTLPRDMETLADLKKATAKLIEEPYVAPKPEYNHPPDWKAIAQLPDTLTIQLETTQGIITMQWLTRHAPASVWNISQLVESKFYDGKYFHRVVPDFVIQGGCPRGDGWGALDWTQRSEVSNELKYVRGTVGLASSGKDTEGVQFFITHCATPHLEGNYTIIGYVSKGMDVVNKIKEGDRIIKMTRI